MQKRQSCRLLSGSLGSLFELKFPRALTLESNALVFGGGIHIQLSGPLGYQYNRDRKI